MEHNKIELDLTDKELGLLEKIMEESPIVHTTVNGALLSFKIDHAIEELILSL